MIGGGKLGQVIRGRGVRLDQAGAAMALFAITLPIFVLCLALVADGGLILMRRGLAYAVADVAALAGVQELDLDRLAQGERHVIAELAVDQALEVAHGSLAENGVHEGDREVRVEVLNASAASPRIHPVTGRELVDPTVHVSVRLRVPLRFWGGLLPAVWVTGRADASVLPRRD